MRHTFAEGKIINENYVTDRARSSAKLLVLKNKFDIGDRDVPIRVENM